MTVARLATSLPAPQSTMSCSPPSSPRYTLKRSRSRAAFPNSSDTECSPPPPPKRARKGSRRMVPVKRMERLADFLRNRLCDAFDETAISDFKIMMLNNREASITLATQDIIDDVKRLVMAEVRREGKRILEVELYVRWLENFEFVFEAMETLLDAQVPGTRRRVSGLGRLTFSILYNLIDGFIDEVNAYQDKWSTRYPAGPIEPDPLVMSIVDECYEDPSDGREAEAIQTAEEIFKRFDSLLAAAVKRYKTECDKKLMASGIARKEESLGRGLCLLNEQTGFGGYNGMGFNLFTESRDTMVAWNNQYGSYERQH